MAPATYGFVDEGDTIELVASTARTAGAVITYGGDTVGIVADTVASGARYNAYVRGKFELAKNTGVTLTPGEDVYWASSEITTVATAGTRLGVAARAAVTLASRGRVLLNQPNAQLIAQT